MTVQHPSAFDVRATEFERKLHANCSTPRKGAGMGAIVRWFDDGLVVLVSVFCQPGKWKVENGRFHCSECQVSSVLRLWEDLPSGAISRDMDCEEILIEALQSFGVVVPDRGHVGEASGWIADCVDGTTRAITLERYAEVVRERCALDIKAAVDAVRDRVSDPGNTKEVRHALEALCDELRAILDRPDHEEEDLHQWLKKHPIFLDTHQTQIWSKMPFGKYVSDFIVKRAGDRYLLVEIETGRTKLFRDGNSEKTAEFTHAIQQVEDWRRYIRRNPSTVQNELDLDGIFEPAGMVVIGRDSGIKTKEAQQRWVDLKAKDPTPYTYDEMLERVLALSRMLCAK